MGRSVAANRSSAPGGPQPSARTYQEARLRSRKSPRDFAQIVFSAVHFVEVEDHQPPSPDHAYREGIDLGPTREVRPEQRAEGETGGIQFEVRTARKQKQAEDNRPGSEEQDFGPAQPFRRPGP